MSRRVFVLGIDGASLDLIKSQIARGGLKNFRRLIDSGSWGALRSCFMTHSSPAWTTVETGKNPGKHGIYDFFLVENYSPKFISAKDMEDKPFWDVLADKEKKSFIINVPFTYPPNIENGVIVTGLQTPLDKKDYIYPENFRAELERICPEYKIFPRTDPRDDLKRCVEENLQILKTQLKLTLHIFKEKEWDLLFYVAQNIDMMQHFLWHYTDKNHSCYQPDDFFSPVIYQFYEIMDKFIGEVLNSIKEDTALVILSDHGAGKEEKNFYVNNWLLREGYIKFGNKPLMALKKFLMKFGRKYYFKMNDIDWSRSVAYSMTFNQIFINLKGRETEGIVEPGEEYRRVRDKLCEDLSKIKHPYKDKPLISQLHKKEEIFSGPKLAGLPDIIFICDDFEINCSGGYKVDSIRLFEDPALWKGSHRLHGVIFAYGKDIKKGYEVNGAKLEDVPATVMALSAGVVPEDFDGRVLEDIFITEELKDIAKTPLATKKKTKKGVFEQDKKIQKTLESLGYM